MHLVQIYLSDSSRAFNVDTLQVRGTSFGPLAMHQLRLLRERVVVRRFHRYTLLSPSWMDSREHFLLSLVDKLSIKCVTNTRVKSTLKIKVMVSFELVRIFTISDIFRFNWSSEALLADSSREKRREERLRAIFFHVVEREAWYNRVKREAELLDARLGLINLVPW